MMKADMTTEEYRRRYGSKRSTAGSTPRGTMNKTEQEHSQNLEIRKRSNDVIQFWYEQITFKLADDTRYTPDFFVQTHYGFEVHEVKGGFMRDDSFVKFKVAASIFPFRFFLYRKSKGEWSVKEYKSGVMK